MKQREISISKANSESSNLNSKSQKSETISFTNNQNPIADLNGVNINSNSLNGGTINKGEGTGLDGGGVINNAVEADFSDGRSLTFTLYQWNTNTETWDLITEPAWYINETGKFGWDTSATSTGIDRYKIETDLTQFTYNNEGYSYNLDNNAVVSLNDVCLRNDLEANCTSTDSNGIIDTEFYSDANVDPTVLQLTNSSILADVNYGMGGASATRYVSEKWDISSIPAGATINNATLCLYITAAFNSGGNLINISYTSNQSWTYNIGATDANSTLLIPSTNVTQEPYNTTVNAYECYNVSKQLQQSYYRGDKNFTVTIGHSLPTATLYNFIQNSSGSAQFAIGNTGGSAIKLQWYSKSGASPPKLSITYTSASDTFPTYSNNLSYPSSPTEYDSGKQYEFNITWNDDNGISSAWLDFNGKNYSMSNGSSTYYKIFTDLPVGTYPYYFWANDTINQINKTSSDNYVINQNSSYALSLSATTPITYGATTDFTGSGCPSQLTCTLNISNAVYGAGTITANYSTAGNANYSASSVTKTVVINKATGIVKTYLGGIEGDNGINIGQRIILDGNLTGEFGSLNMTADGTQIAYSTTSNLSYSYMALPPERTVKINVSYSGSQNYTATSEAWNLVLTIVHHFPQIESTTEYPTTPTTYIPLQDYQFNATILDAGNNIDKVILMFNGTNYTAFNQSANVFNVTFKDLGAGNYTFRWWVNDSNSDINQTVVGNYIINKASSQTSLTFDLASPQTYGTAITPTCSIVTGVGTPALTNGTSGVAETLGAGSWNINCSLADSQNYTASSNFSAYIINKANSLVYTFINGSRSNQNFNNGTTLNLTGYLITGNGNINLTVNLTQREFGTSPLQNISIFNVPAGIYPINTTYLGNQNYTGTSETWILTIIAPTPPAPPSVVVSIFPNIPLSVPHIVLNKNTQFENSIPYLKLNSRLKFA